MTWEDVNVSEFIELQEIALNNDLTPTEKVFTSIEILSGEDLNDLTAKEFEELKKKYDFIGHYPTGKVSELKLNKLSMGAFIDLEKFSTQKNPFLNIEKISARILGFEDFETKCKEILDEPVPMHCKIVYEWIAYREKVLKNYEDLFVSDEDDLEDEDEEQPQPEQDQQEKLIQRWAFERLIYMLADGDITKTDDIFKMPHLKVFNWLTMIKDLKLSRPTHSA